MPIKLDVWKELRTRSLKHWIGFLMAKTIREKMTGLVCFLN